MSRTFFAVIFIVFFAFCALLVVWFEAQGRPVWLAVRALPEQPHLEGTLRIPKAQFEPVIGKAQAEVHESLTKASDRQNWAEALFWLGFCLTVIMTVVAGFFGRSESAKKGMGEASKDEAIKPILQGQQQSTFLVRVVGILIGLATLPNMAVQRLELEATRFANSAKELNGMTVATLTKLYDPKGSEGQDTIALTELENALGK